MTSYEKFLLAKKLEETQRRRNVRQIKFHHQFGV